MKRDKLYNPFYPKPNGKKRAPMNQYIPPAPAILVNAKEMEIWLDLVSAAITGFSASTWSPDGKKINMPSAQVVSRSACEVADGVILALRKRVVKELP